MAVNSVFPPYFSFQDGDGNPLEAGFIYIGQPGFEARTTPKASFFDIANTIATGTASGAAIRTRGGFPVRNGAPAAFYVDGDYSITVTDRNGVLLYTSLNTTLALDVGGAIGPVLGPDGNLGAVGIGFVNEDNTGWIRSAPGTVQNVVTGVVVSQETATGTVFQQPVSGAGFTSGVLAVAQPLDPDLTAIAGIAGVNGDLIVRSGGAWTRLGVGTEGQVPAVSSGAVAWASNPVAAWVNFNGIGTVAIRASRNVSSITDNGTGDYTVNFTNALPDGNYAMCGFSVASSASNVTGASMVTLAPTGAATYLALLKSTTQVRILVGNPNSGTLIDSGDVSVSIFR